MTNMNGEQKPNELLTTVEIDPTITASVANLQLLSMTDIMTLKSQVENKLAKYTDYLESQNVDMSSSLITPEGFPRSDIDVLQVRLVRRNVNMLRNDLKSIIERSHELLKDYFKNDSQTAISPVTTTKNEVAAVAYKIPFAVIQEVATDGPIERAGVKNNDKLVSIGDVHAGNHGKLRNVQILVMGSEGKELSLRILREDKIIPLTLIPTRNWNGQGLLGCRLIES